MSCFFSKSVRYFLTFFLGIYSLFIVGCEMTDSEGQPPRQITSVAIGPKDDRMVFSYNDGTIRYFNVLAGKNDQLTYFEQKLPLPFLTNARSLAFSMDGKKLLAIEDVGDTDKIWIWDLSDLNRLPSAFFRSKESQGKITNVSFSPDGSKIAIGTSGPEVVEILDVSSGKKLLTLHHTFGGDNKVYFMPSTSPSVYRILVVEKTGQLILWTLSAPLTLYKELWAASRELCQQLPMPESYAGYEMRDVQASSDGTSLYYSSVLSEAKRKLKPAYLLTLLDTSEIPDFSRAWFYQGSPVTDESSVDLKVPRCSAARNNLGAFAVCTRTDDEGHMRTVLVEKSDSGPASTEQSSEYQTFREGEVALEHMSPEGSLVVVVPVLGPLEIYRRDNLLIKVEIPL